MWIYLLLPLVLLYTLVFQRLLVVGEAVSVRKTNGLWPWFFILLSVATFRGLTVGTDTSMYYRFFTTHDYRDVEPAVRMLYEGAQSGQHYVLFQFFMSVLFLLCMFYGIRKHCPNGLVGVLFLVLTFIYYTSLNQMRQLVAAAILFCFVDFLLEKGFRKLKFVIVILVASLFHQSALFLLLLLLLPQKRFHPLVALLLFTMTTVFYFTPQLKDGIGQLLSTLPTFYEAKYEQNLATFFLTNKEKGLIEFLPIVAQMLIVLLAYYYPATKEPRINNRFFDLTTNIYVLYLSFYALAGIEAIDRLQVYAAVCAIYFYAFYVHILLRDNQKLVGKLVVAFIFLFWSGYYVLRLLNNNQGIVPYMMF